jgi:hypothetical protein
MTGVEVGIDPPTSTGAPLLTHRNSEAFKGVKRPQSQRPGFRPGREGAVRGDDTRQCGLAPAAARMAAPPRSASSRSLRAASAARMDSRSTRRGTCTWRTPAMVAHGRSPARRARSCTKGRTLTNLAFRGSDNRSLFMTDSATGTIVRAELDVAGKLMFSHARGSSVRGSARGGCPASTRNKNQTVA